VWASLEFPGLSFRRSKHNRGLTSLEVYKYKSQFTLMCYGHCPTVYCGL